MSKELEALENLNDIEKLDWLTFPHKWSNSADTTLKGNCFEYLAKKLKALEIVKEKQVNIYVLLKVESIEEYNSCHFLEILTQEEYDLLKEVLL